MFPRQFYLHYEIFLKVVKRFRSFTLLYPFVLTKPTSINVKKP